MRLLYLQQLLVLPGAAGNDRCWQFARQWAAAGHDVTFVSSTAALPAGHPWRQLPAYPARVAAEGVEVWLLDIPYAHKMSFRRRVQAFAAYYRQAWRLCRRWRGQHDALLAYTAPLLVAWLGRRLARRLGLPFFLEVADVWPEVPIGMGLIPPGPWRAWLRNRTRRAYAAARRIFPFSEGMRDQILAQGVPAAKVVTIPNGADLTAFPFRDRSGHPAGTVRFLYTGTLGVANELSQLMRAWQQVEAAGQANWQLTVIGDGNDATRVRAEAQRLGLRQLTFLPQVPREALRDYLDQADVGLICFAPFPVLAANAATKFFDYLAAGLPLVINYEGWQADYLRAHTCGLAAPMGDEAALAAALIEMGTRSPAERAAMGRRGRALAEETFDRRQL
ncbi:MAG: glycosyltransferase WbuB, partial [Bacteroidetes bacterium]